MLQYKIPQNVQVEDRIVSFLTVRQLIICCVGFGIAYAWYMFINSVPTLKDPQSGRAYLEWWVPHVLVVSSITVAIAFVKINDIRFTKWFLLLMEFFILPRKRVWNKDSTTDLWFQFVSANPNTTQQKEKKKNKQEQKKDLSVLADLTKSVDNNPFRESGEKDISSLVSFETPNATTDIHHT